MNVEIKWPPSNGQGWDKGLCGTANNNTLEAPMDATINGKPWAPTVFTLTKPTSTMATNAIMLLTNFSRWVSVCRGKWRGFAELAKAAVTVTLAP